MLYIIVYIVYIISSIKHTTCTYYEHGNLVITLCLKQKHKCDLIMSSLKTITLGFSFNNIATQIAIAKRPQLLELTASFCMGTISIIGHSENKNKLVTTFLTTSSTSSYSES